MESAVHLEELAEKYDILVDTSAIFPNLEQLGEKSLTDVLWDDSVGESELYRYLEASIKYTKDLNRFLQNSPNVATITGVRKELESQAPGIYRKFSSHSKGKIKNMLHHYNALIINVMSNLRKNEVDLCEDEQILFALKEIAKNLSAIMPSRNDSVKKTEKKQLNRRSKYSVDETLFAYAAYHALFDESPTIILSNDKDFIRLRNRLSGLLHQTPCGSKVSEFYDRMLSVYHSNGIEFKKRESSTHLIPQDCIDKCTPHTAGLFNSYSVPEKVLNLP